MRGLLPSVWLLLAGLYTASLIALIQPFSFGDDWPPPPRNETVRAKEPGHAALLPSTEAAAASFQRVSLVSAHPDSEIHRPR